MTLSKKVANIRVGCQGWNYDDWVTAVGGAKVFYPRGTRAAGMLDVYARAYTSVEVDSTFYAVPSASTVDGWHRRTPDGFTFSLKLPRDITHEHGLRGSGAAEILAEFCDRARRLENKLASVLIQLPPQFEAWPENTRALAEFLPLLPRDIRFSVEFRDGRWFDESVSELLGRYNVALALVEGPWVARERVWRLVDSLTADFAYVRWMGERDLTRFDIVQRPQDLNLCAWAEVIARLGERGTRVDAYFSNFYEGHAPASANKLKRLLGQSTIEPDELEDQPSLF